MFTGTAITPVTMMTMLRLVAFIAVLCGSTTIVSCGPFSKVLVDGLKQCDEYPSLPLTFSDVTLSQVGQSQFVLSGNMEFKRRIESPWKMSVELEKCDSKTNPDTCESFYNLESKDICSQLGKDGQVYSNFIKYANMSKSCPIEPKAYKLDKIPLEVDVSKYPISKGYYRATATTKSKSGEVTACIFTEMEITTQQKG